MSERVLVTGGAGCIGSDLCAALLARECEVVALDNLSSGKIEHVEPLLKERRFRFVHGDILDPAALAESLDRVGLVYHLAANPDVKFAASEPDRDLKQNALVTHALLEAMRVRRITQLAFASTSAVYGISSVQPIAETQPCRPISLYGATKLACEALIGAHTSLFELRAWVFRFANVVGGKVRKVGTTVLSDFIAKLRANPARLQILGNGRQAKSYLGSLDCVDAMLYVVDHSRERFNLYNLGPDDCVTVTRIAELVVAAMGLSAVEYVYSGGEAGWPGDVPRYRLDVTALDRLGWRARQTSEEAVATVVRELLAVR